MQSGGQILWNAFTICRMSKTSWQTGNLDMNKDLENHLRDPLYNLTHWLDISQNTERDKAQVHQVGKKLFGKKIFWWLMLKNWKIWRHQNVFQKTEHQRSPDNPKRWRICFSCSRWFSKIIRKRLRIPRTHSETGIHRKEGESQRRSSWR